MTERPSLDDEPIERQRTNWTIPILLACVVLLLGLVIYLASRGNADQDKLTNISSAAIVGRTPASGDKLCANQSTYDLMKRDLFQRAAQLRGSDQAAFQRLSAAAVVRMDNPVMESEDKATGAVKCSGSLSIDLPPGVQVIGGRRSLSAPVDYTITKAADGSGPVVLLKSADAIVTPLATIAQVGEAGPAQGVSAAAGNANGVTSTPEPVQPAPEPQPKRPPPPAAQPQAPRASPSFDCASARTRGEVAVCSDPGLATLDRQMASEYSRAYASASPDERDVLRQSAHRFYSYRDRCPTRACIADTYAGRMREIQDIVEGR